MIRRVDAVDRLPDDACVIDDEVLILLSGAEEDVVDALVDQLRPG